MTRARKIITVSPTDAKLNALARADLLVLLRPLTSAPAAILESIAEDRLRDAARSYMRTGKLTAQAVLDYQPEVAA